MKKFQRIIVFLLTVSLVAVLTMFTAGATDAGDSFMPDMGAWGTQNNNGWYFLYRDKAGSYHEMTYRDSSAAISWQRDTFASDPDTDMEMFFISKTEFFVGENGTLPAYGFKAPTKGQVELTFETHGLSDMRITVFRNTDTLKTISLNTSGPNGGFTTQQVTANVEVGDMLYLVGSSTGSNREAWVHDLKVTYLQVGSFGDEDETEPTEPEPTEPDKPVEPPIAPAPAPGVTYAHSDNAWGAQDNYHWFYMYRSVGGQYEKLNYYGSDSEIPWQRNSFAFDPYAMNEMLFINRNSCFVGESGSLPAYAFRCPSGGEVELSVLTHGQEDMRAELLKGGESLQKISLNTSGPEAGFTKTTVRVDVKQGEWLYIVISSAGENREAWIKDYSATYLSVNDEQKEEEEQTLYTPSKEKWGRQNNNGWYYLEKGRDNVYNEMPWHDGSAEIDWQKNAFASVPDVAQEMYFIAWQKFFVGELDTSPVYAFHCPRGGQAELTLITHGPDTLRVTVRRNKEVIETFALSTDGPEAGFTKHTFVIDVKEGTWLYVEGSKTGEEREGYISYYAVNYLSFNNEKEVPDNSLSGTVYTPDMDKLQQNNNGWYYMYYDRLLQRYERLPFYGSGAAIDWQRNAFAFDPYMMAEMLFMTNEHYFIGENGSCPVYAFQCPSGGRVRLKVFTHGREDMYMKVYHNNTQISQYSYNTTGSYNGFTQHLEEMDVGKGDWIYLVCGSTGADRDGWLSFYGVEYLSENDKVGGHGQPWAYTPNLTYNWGKQNNNGWSFQYLDKADGLFRKLAFVRSSGMFEGTSEGGYEYLLVKQLEMHPSVKGNPAKVFTCERGGRVQISFQAWMQAPQLSLTKTGIAVYHNGTKVWPEEEDYFVLGSKQYIQRVVVDAAAGDDIAVVLDAIDSNNSFDATNVRVCASYFSYNDRERTQWPEYPPEVRPQLDFTEPAETAEPTETEEPIEQDSVDETEPTEDPTVEPETEPTEEEQESGGTLAWIVVGVVAAAAGLGGAAVLQMKKRRSKH